MDRSYRDAEIGIGWIADRYSHAHVSGDGDAFLFGLGDAVAGVAAGDDDADARLDCSIDLFADGAEATSVGRRYEVVAEAQVGAVDATLAATLIKISQVGEPANAIEGTASTFII